MRDAALFVWSIGVQNLQVAENIPAPGLGQLFVLGNESGAVDEAKSAELEATDFGRWKG